MDEKIELILFYTKDNQGIDIFIYLGMLSKKRLMFQKALKANKLIKPSDYGVIIEWGFGQPNRLLKAQMEYLFDFKHEEAA